MRIVAALGGNALLQRGERPDASVQFHHLEEAVPSLATLRQGNQLILTHGNGPQIGLLALESEGDQSLSSPYPLDALGAQTQGMIGYWIASELRGDASAPLTCAVITRVVVDTRDQAFGDPTKFVGRSYEAREAAELAKKFGWTVKQDGNAWRRVVPSPLPLRIVELPVIEGLVSLGYTVVCGGGGGIPVTEAADGKLVGVEAVIDKDLTSAQLAIELAADMLLILTDVDAVYQDYGTDRAVARHTLTLQELSKLNLPDGSMGPKVRAASAFVQATGKSAIIGSLLQADQLLAGKAGTKITVS